MIISEFKPGQTIADTDKLLNQLVKGRVEKMTNETIDEIDRVISRLTDIRRNYRAVFVDYPQIDIDLKNQINELKRLNQWIKKEVE